MSPQFTISEDQIERAIGVEYPRPMGRGDWLEDVEQQFRAIANLPHGWDSYGSPPPDIGNLNAAAVVLQRLCRGADLPKPHVNPTPSGGVQFDWEEGSRYFEIEVAEGAVTYLFCDYDAGVEDSGELSDEDPLDPIVRYVRRVTAHAPSDHGFGFAVRIVRRIRPLCRSRFVTARPAARHSGVRTAYS